MSWAGDGAPGVVVVHGFGSGRVNHADYVARVGAAGMSALAIDLRGHGDSGGVPDAGSVDDVVAAVSWLVAAGAGPVGLRGSSLGAFLALNAVPHHPAIRAVVAICAAHQEGLATRRGLDWARDHPLERAVDRDDGVARGYWHARGDELVPWQWSWLLASRSCHPKHLRVVMGGDHRSLQHDPAVQTDTVAFLRRALSGE